MAVSEGRGGILCREGHGTGGGSLSPQAEIPGRPSSHPEPGPLVQVFIQIGWAKRKSL